MTFATVTDLNLRDPAVRAMTDFRRSFPLTDLAFGVDFPAVDWWVLQSARIVDLLEIFHGAGVMHLVVVEGTSLRAPPLVRGLISRLRVERRLATP